MKRTGLTVLAAIFIGASGLGAGEFKAVSVSYKLNKTGRSNTILIPQYSGDYQPPIRGVMQEAGGPLNEFAHKNQVALIKKLDQGRGFSKELLVAAAEAAGRPELAFAGAIVQGISAQGREAAKWAAANRDRAIAVILDHSFCWGIGQPVMVAGVPMYFNATYQNLFQNHDRRKLQGQWCKGAYRRRQPCTSIIDFVKGGGHGGRGTTTLTALWLDEAMNHRVPLNVPVGKAYHLIDVDPAQCGGYVSIEFAMEGKRSYHTNVKVLTRSAGASWWVPGPKSAALYLEWVNLNGGSIAMDNSVSIPIALNFIDLKGDLKKVVGAFKKKKLALALATLSKSATIDKNSASKLTTMINDEVKGNLSILQRLEEAGDVYGIQENLKNEKKRYVGIPAYDEKLAYYGELFRKEEVVRELKLGKRFYSLIERINETRKASTSRLRSLKSFAEKFTESKYGQVAQQAYDSISTDPTIRPAPQKYFLK